MYPNMYISYIYIYIYLFYPHFPHGFFSPKFPWLQKCKPTFATWRVRVSRTWPTGLEGYLLPERNEMLPEKGGPILKRKESEIPTALGFLLSKNQWWFSASVRVWGKDLKVFFSGGGVEWCCWIFFVGLSSSWMILGPERCFFIGNRNDAEILKAWFALPSELQRVRSFLLHFLGRDYQVGYLAMGPGWISDHEEYVKGVLHILYRQSCM